MKIYRAILAICIGLCVFGMVALVAERAHADSFLAPTLTQDGRYLIFTSPVPFGNYMGLTMACGPNNSPYFYDGMSPAAVYTAFHSYPVNIHTVQNSNIGYTSDPHGWYDFTWSPGSTAYTFSTFTFHAAIDSCKGHDIYAAVLSSNGLSDDPPSIYALLRWHWSTDGDVADGSAITSVGFGPPPASSIFGPFTPADGSATTTTSVFFSFHTHYTGDNYGTACFRVYDESAGKDATPLTGTCTDISSGSPDKTLGGTYTGFTDHHFYTWTPYLLGTPSDPPLLYPAMSFGINTSPPPVGGWGTTTPPVASSTNPTGVLSNTCDTTDGLFIYSFCALGNALFVPSTTTVQAWSHLEDNLSRKPPFGWITLLQTYFGAISTTTASTTIAVPGFLQTYIFSPLDLILTAAMGILALVWFFNRARLWEWHV